MLLHELTSLPVYREPVRALLFIQPGKIWLKISGAFSVKYLLCGRGFPKKEEEEGEEAWTGMHRCVGNPETRETPQCFQSRRVAVDFTEPLRALREANVIRAILEIRKMRRREIK